ncbi:MAG: PQQ-binding-like beta-propeller repeat protein [Acidobacteriota bacterium]
MSASAPILMTPGFLCAALGGLLCGLPAMAQDAPDPGSLLFEEYCSICHEPAIGGAPTVESMNAMSADRIFASMDSGIMEEQATDLSEEQMLQVSRYLAGELTGATDIDRGEWSCSGARPAAGRAVWAGWGFDLQNRRHLDDAQHSFRAASLDGLELRWAFGFPGAVRARSQPIVTEKLVIVGSQEGTIFALDRYEGCVWWTYEAEAEVRSSLTLVEGEGVDGEEGLPQTLHFGDFEGSVYAIDANTGEEVWKRDVSDHKDATITGSVAHHDGRLFVPMSSTEIVSAFYKEYECCTFRGGVLALDAATGKTLWRMYTTDEPTKRKKNSAGVQLWGPSGAPVWSAPTVDVERGLIYVGTGENYSTPANDMSDAIIALQQETGEIVWVQQTIEGDAWNGACVGPKVNCPEEDGPDFDFGAPPILASVGDRDLILAGQKSGMIFGIDPDSGEIVWEQRMGMGGFNGGVHWGMAVAGDRLIVPITDTPGNRFTTGEPRPGLHSLDLLTGRAQWSTIHPKTCTGKRECYFHGLSMAITTTSELVFAGSLDGLLSIYRVADGERLWTFQTRRDFETINGVEGRGGTLDSDGVVLAGNQLFVNSGYDKWGEFAGNVLLLFEVKEEDGAAADD